jgi:hypothetical protein
MIHLSHLPLGSKNLSVALKEKPPYWGLFLFIGAEGSKTLIARWGQKYEFNLANPYTSEPIHRHYTGLKPI